MLHSERKFKIKVRLGGTVFEILFMRVIMCIERVLHGNEIVELLQKYKHHEVDEGHSRKLL